MSGVVIKKEFNFNIERTNEALQSTRLVNTYSKVIDTTRRFTETYLALTYHISSDTHKKNKTNYVNIQRINSIKSDEISNIINKSFDLSNSGSTEIKTVYLSKNISKSQIFMETFSASSDIINIEKGINERGGVKMTEKLLKTRDQIENAGVYLGFVLAFVTFLLPLFTPIPLNAIIPGTLMFLSLPIFVYIRKWVRRDDK